MHWFEIVLITLVGLSSLGIAWFFYDNWKEARDKRLKEEELQRNKESCPFKTDQHVCVKFKMYKEKPVGKDKNLETYIYQAIGYIEDITHEDKTAYIRWDRQLCEFRPDKNHFDWDEIIPYYKREYQREYEREYAK